LTLPDGDEFSDIDLVEGEDLECKLAAGRDNQGELPRSVWETYSAMANTHGGVILLGVREKNSKFSIEGIANPAKVTRDFFAGLSNRNTVSTNLLNTSSVRTIRVKGKDVIRIDVPQASRQDRPVFVFGNVLTGTFRRLDEGDHRCNDSVVKRMLAEQLNDNRDSRILDNFGLADLNQETLAAYRRQFQQSLGVDHPFLSSDDRHFLQCLGSWAVDRNSKQEGLTVAGLLMFGNWTSIREAVPTYHLDYQEVTQSLEDRWIDRVSLDGTWSGNLFDFYKIVYRKLTFGLKLPFHLQSDVRVQDSTVHQAIREALVNCLIHADYDCPGSIKIVKAPDSFVFRNPGGLRVPKMIAISGGHPDCRNKRIQKMFEFAGLGENAGSGLPKIWSAWQKQGWLVPNLLESINPEFTQLELRMASLFPPEILNALTEHLGEKFTNADELKRLIMILACIEGGVKHKRVKEFTASHPRDITLALSKLVKDGILLSEGEIKDKSYSIADSVLSEKAAGLSHLTNRPIQLSLAGLSSEHKVLNSEHKDPNSEHTASSSELKHPGSGSSEELLTAKVLKIPAVLKIRNSKRSSPEFVKEAILAICAEDFVPLRLLAKLLNRKSDSLRVHYLPELLQSNQITERFPGNQTHPDQAYRCQKIDE